MDVDLVKVETNCTKCGAPLKEQELAGLELGKHDQRLGRRTWKAIYQCRCGRGEVTAHPVLLNVAVEPKTVAGRHEVLISQEPGSPCETLGQTEEEALGDVLDRGIAYLEDNGEKDDEEDE